MHAWTDGTDYLMHHGIKGQKWGVRRYQNPDGTLTEAGRKRYLKDLERQLNKEEKRMFKEKSSNDIASELIRASIRDDKHLKQIKKATYINRDLNKARYELESAYQKLDVLKNMKMEEDVQRWLKDYTQEDINGDLIKTLRDSARTDYGKDYELEVLLKNPDIDEKINDDKWRSNNISKNSEKIYDIVDSISKDIIGNTDVSRDTKLLIRKEIKSYIDNLTPGFKPD